MMPMPIPTPPLPPDTRALLLRIREWLAGRTSESPSAMARELDAVLEPPMATMVAETKALVERLGRERDLRALLARARDSMVANYPAGFRHPVVMDIDAALAPPPAGGEPQPAPERVCPCCANGGGSTACWCAEWCPGHWSLPPSALPTAEEPGVGTLLPCPFCGGPASAFWHGYVDCPACGAFGPDRTPDSSAEALWNRRAPTAEERERDLKVRLSWWLDHAGGKYQEVCRRDRAALDALPEPEPLTTVREACRQRWTLGGADAQMLDGALSMTERERDVARAELGRVRAAHEETVRQRDNLRYNVGTIARERDEALASLTEECARVAGLNGEVESIKGERDRYREALRESAEEAHTANARRDMRHSEPNFDMCGASTCRRARRALGDAVKGGT